MIFSLKNSFSVNCNCSLNSPMENIVKKETPDIVLQRFTVTKEEWSSLVAVYVDRESFFIQI